MESPKFTPENVAEEPDSVESEMKKTFGLDIERTRRETIPAKEKKKDDSIPLTDEDIEPATKFEERIAAHVGKRVVQPPKLPADVIRANLEKQAAEFVPEKFMKQFWKDYEDKLDFARRKAREDWTPEEKKLFDDTLAMAKARQALEQADADDKPTVLSDKDIEIIDEDGDNRKAA